jgi:hypothetical protein
VLSNYTITYHTANFTITPRAASVTPNAASKTYGAADPTLTGTLSGFLPADHVAATYSRTAGETVRGGPYTISASLTGVVSNYAITSNTARFTITAAPPKVTVSDAGGTYTGHPFPAMGTVAGVSGSPGSTLEGVGLTFTYYVGSGTAGTKLGSSAPSNVGTYTVVATFAGSTDYTSASARATFTINQQARSVNPPPAVSVVPPQNTPATSNATSTTPVVANDTPAPADTTTGTDNSTSSGQDSYWAQVQAQQQNQQTQPQDYNDYWAQMQALEEEIQAGVTLAPPQTQDYNDYWAQVQMQQQAEQYATVPDPQTQDSNDYWAQQQ